MSPNHPPAVQGLSLILTWPLAARQNRDGCENRDGCAPCSLDALVKAVLAGRGTPWKRMTFPSQHARPAGAWTVEPSGGYPAEESSHTPMEYGESLYFYPFVRTFLHHDPKALVVLRRDDITGLALEGKESGQTFRLNLEVRRVALHCFGTGEAVLVTEVHWDPRTDPAGIAPSRSLDHAQFLLERLRHAYAPFFGGESDNAWPGYALDRIVWRKEGGATQVFHPSEREVWPQAEGALRTPPDRTPIYPHWRALLPDVTGAGLHWRQILDDRMGCLAHLRLDRPEAVPEKDWVRLGGLDGPGGKLPYAPEFLADFQKDHCYDRYWAPAHDPDLRTRYLCTGYAFVMVTDDEWFARTILHGHFRHHYFQMALISYFQIAALHGLSDRLAQAAAGMRSDCPVRARRGRAELRDILWDIMHFTHTYWFTDLTHQLQGREMFQLWRKHLAVTPLYEQVTREAAETNALLNREEDRRTAIAAEHFNWIAAFGVVLGVSVGFLGMNIIVPDYESSPSWFNGREWRDGALVLAAVLGTAATVTGLAAVVGTLSPPWRVRVLVALGGLAIVGLLGYGLDRPAEAPPTPPPALCGGPKAEAPGEIPGVMKGPLGLMRSTPPFTGACR